MVDSVTDVSYSPTFTILLTAPTHPHPQIFTIPLPVSMGYLIRDN